MCVCIYIYIYIVFSSHNIYSALLQRIEHCSTRKSTCRLPIHTHTHTHIYIYIQHASSTNRLRIETNWLRSTLILQWQMFLFKHKGDWLVFQLKTVDQSSKNLKKKSRTWSSWKQLFLKLRQKAAFKQRNNKQFTISFLV